MMRLVDVPPYRGLVSPSSRLAVGVPDDPPFASVEAVPIEEAAP